MKISSVLADVKNWEQLADRLNMDALVVEGVKARCWDKYTNNVEREKCYRSELVQYLCDQQQPNGPNEVAENIAVELESMNMRPEAETLRQLELGKVIEIYLHSLINIYRPPHLEHRVHWC